jgi:DNA-binding transcriptional ArsR family regulator
MQRMPEQTSVATSYARALANPVRLGIVGALAQGPRTIESLSRQLDTRKDRVRRHARVLEGMGLVQATDAQPRTYELVREPVVWEQAWSELPIPARRETMAAILTHVHATASAAVDAGGFDRPDSYLTRSSLRVSEELWREIAELLGDTVRRLDAAEDDPNGTPATVVTMLFSGEHADTTTRESPPPDFDAAEARERTYEIVEEVTDIMARDAPMSWDRAAALFEQARLIARAAASLDDARQPAPADPQ